MRLILFIASMGEGITITQTTTNLAVGLSNTFYVIGCDFLLMRGLNLAIGAGYGTHIIKVRNAEWSNVNETIINNPYPSFARLRRNFFDLKLRLSYTLSIKKTKKT